MAEKIEIPGTGEVVEDRRRGERRRDERRQAPRREEDRRFRRVGTIWAGFWALVGSVVVLYLFFVAIGGVDPDDARAASIVVLVLAVLWLAHAWRRLWTGGYSSRGDRERRGF